VLFSVSLVPTAGGSARPDGTSVSTLGSSARFGLRGGKRGDKVLARRGRVVVPVLESPQSLPPTLASVVRAAGR
jgi:hypothetical protein